MVTFRYAPSARALLKRRRREAGTVPDGILAVDEPRPVSGPRLVNSQREAKAAASHFRRRCVLTHKQATREAVSAELSNYSVLHFSCHGSPDFSEPLNSGLVMAGEEMLSLRDLLDLELTGTQLAVLSACATGVVGLELPDEAFGLPSGLLQAGAQGVVSSLWLVRDDSTTMLMARFYEFWRNEGLVPAEALRAAQRWLRDTSNAEKLDFFKQSLPEFAGTRMSAETADSLYQLMSLREPHARDFAHPLHWAAFIYTGV